MLCAMVLASLPAYAEKITIAATVNDEVITSNDVALRRALVMANTNLPDTEQAKARITPQVLDTLINETLQMQDAKRQGITVTDEQVEKAIQGMGTPAQPEGAVKAEILARGLSLKALENQTRAQLAWGNVVQRKLRRNVTITQDEITRAKQAQEAEINLQEIRLSVIAIGVASAEQEAPAQAAAKEIADALATGADMPSVASKFRAVPNLNFTPLLWVSEERTPPALFALIREAQPGSLVGPVRSGNVIQFVKVMERRAMKKPSPTTELLLKQIMLDTPSMSDPEGVVKLSVTKEVLAANPGSCEDTSLPPTPLAATAAFARMKMGSLPPEQQQVLARLEVGALSEPMILPGKLQMILVCERTDAIVGGVIDEDLRQKIFVEKMDLEAQKHLRNLRRDATIDVRGTP